MEIKCIQSIGKGKISEAVSGSFAKKWLFCKICVLYNVFFHYRLRNFLKNITEVVHS